MKGMNIWLRTILLFNHHIRCINLQAVEKDCCQAQPAVQTVHVGDLGTVVEVERCHHGYDNEAEGQKVQTGVDELHRQFSDAPGPGEAVNNDCCKKMVTNPRFSRQM